MSGDGGAVKTQQTVRVDVRGTWKPYRMTYEVIKALRELETGSVVEVITKDDKGIVKDIGTWCEATGHEFLGSQPQGEADVRSLIRKGSRRGATGG